MDLDNDGFLSIDDFLRFYTDASRTRLSTVWKNLQSHGYRNDLKLNEELGNEDIDVT